jgi:hypothetical protein
MIGLIIEEQKAEETKTDSLFLESSDLSLDADITGDVGFGGGDIFADDKWDLDF